MGTHNCTVRHDSSHVWVLDEMLQHVGPDTVRFPAGRLLEETAPLAITVWQRRSLGASAQYPVNCLNETATPEVGLRRHKDVLAETRKLSAIEFLFFFM